MNPWRHFSLFLNNVLVIAAVVELRTGLHKGCLFLVSSVLANSVCPIRSFRACHSTLTLPFQEIYVAT